MDRERHSRNSEDQDPRAGQPTAPSEPDDIDALLAESLRAQSERDFTWKEPERSPRWWERAEASTHSSGELKPSTGGDSAAASRGARGVRLGSVVFALVCLVLAGWVIGTVAFGLAVEPLVVGLVICSVAGLSLIIGGLRPKPGTRI